MVQFKQQELMIHTIKHLCQVTKNTRNIHFLVPCFKNRMCKPI